MQHSILPDRNHSEGNSAILVLREAEECNHCKLHTVTTQNGITPQSATQEQKKAMSSDLHPVKPRMQEFHNLPHRIRRTQVCHTAILELRMQHSIPIHTESEQCNYAIRPDCKYSEGENLIRLHNESEECNCSTHPYCKYAECKKGILSHNDAEESKYSKLPTVNTQNAITPYPTTLNQKKARRRTCIQETHRVQELHTPSPRSRKYNHCTRPYGKYAGCKKAILVHNEAEECKYARWACCKTEKQQSHTLPQ